jgi:lipoprotein NlpD
MYLYRSMPFLWVILIVQVLLPGCFQQPAYAPVTLGNQTPDKEVKPVLGKPVPDLPKIETIKAKPVTLPIKEIVPLVKEAQILGKYYVVKSGDTLYSIGVKSGQGYERLAQWNQIPSPYRVVLGHKLKLFKPDSSEVIGRRGQIEIAKKPPLAVDDNIETVGKSFVAQQKSETLAVKITSKQEKKSIISNDNKKMLKLNFAWPIKGRLSKNFQQSNNKGIDIAGKIGQKVQAAESGRIAFSGQGLIGFGNLIIIKHNDLYLSAYGNNSNLLVKEGQQVEKGQVIAEVGKALSKKAALHFEIRKNGKPVNPLTFLPKSDKAH